MARYEVQAKMAHYVNQERVMVWTMVEKTDDYTEADEVMQAWRRKRFVTRIVDFVEKKEIR